MFFMRYSLAVSDGNPDLFIHCVSCLKPGSVEQGSQLAER